jgi:hypothetical protein
LSTELATQKPQELDRSPLVSDYLLLAPDGRRVCVPRQLFDAVVKFRDGKSNGSVQISFKCGGIAGVEATERTIYK